MNTRHSWKYFWKRVFAKKSTWAVLLLWFIIIGFLFFAIRKSSHQKPEDLINVKGGGWFLGRQLVEYEEKEKGGGVGFGVSGYIDPKINSINDFFACVFPNLIFLPILIWTLVFSPLSWIFWGQFDDVGQKTQTDGTDLFFLSTEIPTSRKNIFWRKLTFLTTFFSVLYLILFALPLSFLLVKSNYFSNFTGLQTFLFLACNFLVIPLFLFVPLVVLLFSLASLNSVWYTVLKWFGRLSIIVVLLLWLTVYQTLRHGGGIGEKILQWSTDFSNWLKQNYLLTTLTIVGVVIFLALFALSLAYREYQKKDLH